MASDIDQNKLKVAIDWITKLANGVNPINDSILPDTDIVNNVHVSRCLFYVSNVLIGIEKKPIQTKQYDQDFSLSPEVAAKVPISERTGITMFVREINKVIPENMKPLTAIKVNQWLASLGYLEEQEKNDGHKYRAPTELGISIGITATWKDGSQGPYLAVSYDANAQHFILENLIKL